jgi:hypothetical protein
MPIMDHEAYDYEWLENQNKENRNLERQKAKEVASVG